MQNVADMDFGRRRVNRIEAGAAGIESDAHAACFERGTRCVSQVSSNRGRRTNP